MKRILGAVLAGGRSTRFGSDKALATVAGRSLLDWSIRAIEPYVSKVVVCGRSDGLADRPAGQLGPLAGLNAALHEGKRDGFEAVLSVPCDAFRLPSGLLAILSQPGVATYLSVAPVIGLWPCALADELDKHVAGSNRSMRSWAQRIGAVAVALEHPLINVNTPADLVALIADGS